MTADPRNDLLSELVSLAEQAEQLGPADIEKAERILRRAEEVNALLEGMLESVRTLLGQGGHISTNIPTKTG